MLDDAAPAWVRSSVLGIGVGVSIGLRLVSGLGFGWGLGAYLCLLGVATRRHLVEKLNPSASMRGT